LIDISFACSSMLPPLEGGIYSATIKKMMQAE
ncbi:MAG: hypothetical protein RI973_2282, partial [Bacteroidota bacterium]